jgi:hypothetical protein
MWPAMRKVKGGGPEGQVVQSSILLFDDSLHFSAGQSDATFRSQILTKVIRHRRRTLGFNRCDVLLEGIFTISQIKVKTVRM